MIAPTPGLKSLFENELENYRTAVRNGDIDPSDGFHPTLSSAIDSLMQAPEDIVFAWFGIDYNDDEQEVEPFARLADEYLYLANMVCIHGPNAKLVDFT